MSEYFSKMRSLGDTFRFCEKDISDKNIIIQISWRFRWKLWCHSYNYQLKIGSLQYWWGICRVKRNHAQKSGWEANVAFKGGKENYNKMKVYGRGGYGTRRKREPERKFIGEEAMGLEEKENLKLWWKRWFLWRQKKRKTTTLTMATSITVATPTWTMKL